MSACVDEHIGSGRRQQELRKVRTSSADDVMIRADYIKEA
jgi:hypothetical protein